MPWGAHLSRGWRAWELFSDHTQPVSDPDSLIVYQLYECDLGEKENPHLVTISLVDLCIFQRPESAKFWAITVLGDDMIDDRGIPAAM